MVVEGCDRPLSNGKPVIEAQLAGTLSDTVRMPIEPEPQFAPDPAASHGREARTMRIIHLNGVTNLGFVGNE